MDASTTLWFLYVSLASFLLYKLFASTKTSSGKARRRAPGPAPLPLVGNILELRGEPHHALARLAETHGPVMSLRLGTTDAIVVSSAAAARDVLQRYDHVLAARSVSDAGRALGNHEHSVIWLPCTSPLWKRLRAVCTNHLFSARALDATRAAREEGVRQLVACLGRHAGAGDGEAVDVGRAVFSCVLNLVSRALFSEDVVADLSSDRAQELEMLVRDTVEEVTKPNLSDLFPVLARLDLQGRRRRSAEFVARFYDFFDPIIARRVEARGSGEKIDDDFLDVLLQLHSMDQLSLQTIKSFLLDLFAAGTDTNAITVEWTMAELLRHPAVMSKVRAELRDALGSKPHPDESDIGRLPYLRAVVMESMRLHPPSPMLMPHLAMADGAEVGGFEVPAGTKVIINLWAIMRDPATWAEPEAFSPERFVGASDADFRGKDRLEFMPFGAGRRACPGTPMATRVVTLLLASMLHAFEWKLPEGMQPADVDVRDRFGTSLNMVTPLKAVPVPSHR
ncbi:unnamed protein product [Miscanthus lutarioriparius]|uniref:Cytochrome P450 n=1 Tax=Miscanthus lutarioriparius TaxID=422564 RepID=A0A811NAS5_9POAL|nr:unnamed protein product [Miscanthus lutarioriparius]